MYWVRQDKRIAQAQAVTESKRSKPELRLTLLDSIRGWAAVDVMIFHLSHEVFFDKLPEFRTFWLGILDGGFAVAIFFIVSGEALSHSYFIKNSIDPLRKLAIKRYVRLTIPIFVSCLIAFILMKTHLVFSQDAARIVERPDWLGIILSFQPSLASFLSYSLFGAYLSLAVEGSYNPVLWTMTVELSGSLFVILTLFLARSRVQRLAIYALAAPFIMVFSPFLMCFIAGMIFSEMRIAGVFTRLAVHPATNWLCVIALIGVVAGLTLVPILQVFGHKLVAHRVSIAAIVFLFAIYSSSLLQYPLNNRVSRFLGEISFPLYLVHMLVIVSLESYLILHLFPDGIVVRSTAYLIMLATMAASLLAAVAFVYVERFAIKSSNSFFAFIDGL